MATSFMSWRFVQLSCCALTATTFLACSERTDSTAPEGSASVTDITSIEQAVIHPTLTLGEGFDPSASALQDGPTNNVCVNKFGVEISPELNRSGRWFVTHTEEDVEVKLSGALAGKVKGKELATEFGQELKEAHFSKGVEKTVLGAVFEIRTVRRNLEFSLKGFDPLNPEQQSNKCDSENENTLFESLDAFLAGCGDRYLESEVLGGHILVSFDITDLVQDLQGEYEASLKLGSTTDQFSDPGGVDGSVNALIDLSSQFESLGFTIHASGIPSPGMNLIEQDGTFLMGNWTAYMTQIEQGVASAISQGERGRHLSYGTVIEQDFQYYTVADVDQCSVTGEGFGLFQSQLACYSDFWRQDFELYGTPNYAPYSQIANDVEQVRWKFENPSLVRMGPPKGDHTGAVRVGA